MGILKGLAKVALSPLCGISEVAKDLVDILVELTPLAVIKG